MLHKFARYIGVALAPLFISCGSAGNGQGGADAQPAVITAPTGVVLYDETHNPLLLSLIPAGSDVTTLYGEKSTEGLAELIDGFYFGPVENPTSRIEFNPVGLPSIAYLEDGTVLRFAWVTASSATVTIVLLDGRKVDVPLSFPAQPAGNLPLGVGRKSHVAPLSSDLLKATLIATVSSQGMPVVQADVRARVKTRNSSEFILPLKESGQGKYTTSFVNNPSKIPPGTLERACNSTVELAQDTCKFGIPVSAYMIQAGCPVLAAAAVVFIGPGATGILLACGKLFTATAATCGAVSLVPGRSGPAVCSSLAAVVSLFDEDGVSINVSARQGQRVGSVTTDVPGRQTRVDVGIVLPPESCVHRSRGGSCTETQLLRSVVGSSIRVGGVFEPLRTLTCAVDSIGQANTSTVTWALDGPNGSSSLLFDAQELVGTYNPATRVIKVANAVPTEVLTPPGSTATFTINRAISFEAVASHETGEITGTITEQTVTGWSLDGRTVQCTTTSTFSSAPVAAP